MPPTSSTRPSLSVVALCPMREGISAEPVGRVAGSGASSTSVTWPDMLNSEMFCRETASMMPSVLSSGVSSRNWLPGSTLG